MATAKSILKPIVLTSFPRGDTPLFVAPITVNGIGTSLAGWTGYLTFTTNSNPTTNSDSFLHRTMTTGLTITDPVYATYGPCFYYQFTNSDTETFVPGTTYYFDVQINKAPSSTNNFTILKGTFVPDTDYGRGLS